MGSSEAPDPVGLFRAWQGERTQDEVARLLGVSQQSVSKILVGKEIGTKVRLACKRHIGIPLAAWPTPDPTGIVDADLDDEAPSGSAAE